MIINMSKKHLENIYAVCGVSWFIMDCFWFFNLYPFTIIFGIITLFSAIGGYVLYRNEDDVNHKIALAVLSWVVINLCSLFLDFIQDDYFITILKMIGFIFMIISIQSLISIVKTNSKILDKFKRL